MTMSRTARWLTIAIAALLVSRAPMRSCETSHASDSPSSSARQFEFTYEVRVPAQPAGSAVFRLWIPLPTDDAYQQISGLKITSPVAYHKTRESEYGDRLAYFVPTSEQEAAGFTVEMHFTALRREHKVSLARLTSSSDEALPPEMMRRYLEADHMVPLDGVIAQLSREQTQGVTDPLEKARKIYDYVEATMKYDKSGTGWGHGDAIWACAAKRGNCTDFHSLFIGMARAAGIPARFEIGFSVPTDKTSGEIPGYHCWAEFYIAGIGWVPIDASEGWKHPEKRDYFFGAHDVNRVQFTTGRDLRLSPAQAGDPLNFFIYPYAEMGGKFYDQVQTHFSFQDVGTNAAALNQTSERTPDGAK